MEDQYRENFSEKSSEVPFFEQIGGNELADADVPVVNASEPEPPPQAQNSAPERRRVVFDEGGSKVVRAPWRVPWWVFVVFGALAVCVSLIVFILHTHCPCEHKSPTVEPPEQSDPKQPSTEQTNGDVSLFVVQWLGTNAPTDGVKLHFLLDDAPFTTYSCNSKILFSSAKRVRIAVPKAKYLVRATFGDGTQKVCDEAWHGDCVVTLTESTMTCEHDAANLSASSIPSEACMSSS